MAAGENESVAAGPVGVLRIVSHRPCVQDVPDGREGHWRAWMPRVGFLNRVHRQGANGIDAEKIEIAIGHCLAQDSDG